MKGTYIKVKNDVVFSEVKKLSSVHPDLHTAP